MFCENIAGKSLFSIFYPLSKTFSRSNSSNSIPVYNDQITQKFFLKLHPPFLIKNIKKPEIIQELLLYHKKEKTPLYNKENRQELKLRSFIGDVFQSQR